MEYTCGSVYIRDVQFAVYCFGLHIDVQRHAAEKMTHRVGRLGFGDLGPTETP